MKKRNIAIASIYLIIIVVPSGFAYAYFNNIAAVNQTKSDIESLGYSVTTNTTNADLARMNITVVNFDTFISKIKLFGEGGGLYQQGDSFYLVLPVFQTIGEAIEYTPNSVWWIW